MLATFAFDVCHDVYRAARDVIDSKIATLNLESSGKYVWHPDRVPHLAEYVADFARAGDRALSAGVCNRGRIDGGKHRSDSSSPRSVRAPRVHGEQDETLVGADARTRPDTTLSFRAQRGISLRSRMDENLQRDSSSPSAPRNDTLSPGGYGGRHDAGGYGVPARSPRCVDGPPRASRMVMFRIFYLGGAEYNAARRHLGISEFTWADWADEIRAAVGRELTRAGMFPPSKYFLELTMSERGRATDGTYAIGGGK